MSRITEKLCAFVKYPVALGIEEIFRLWFAWANLIGYNMSLNADFTIYRDLSFRKLVYHLTCLVATGIQSQPNLKA